MGKTAHFGSTPNSLLRASMKRIIFFGAGGRARSEKKPRLPSGSRWLCGVPCSLSRVILQALTFRGGESGRLASSTSARLTHWRRVSPESSPNLVATDVMMPPIGVVLVLVLEHHTDGPLRISCGYLVVCPCSNPLKRWSLHPKPLWFILPEGTPTCFLQWGSVSK